jgi:hypothetical protein
MLKMKLATIYARWVLGGSVRSEIYEYGGLQRRVIWVDSEQWLMAGQNLFGMIFLNESKLRDCSDDLKDYIFLHEVGHSQFNALFSIIIFVLRLVLMGIALLAIPALAAGLLGVLFQVSSLADAAVIFVTFAFVMLFILFPFVTVSWFDEGCAELFAVAHLGTLQYLDCCNEIRRESDSGRFKRALFRLIYPPPKLIAWWVNRRN